MVVKRAPLEPGLWLRLSHEAEVLDRLAHPRIPAIRSLSRQSHHLTLVLQYLPGLTLAERLRDGPLGPDEAGALALSALELLEQTHALGVLHRDLKPANMVCQAQQVALIDWGLPRGARLHGALREVPVGTARYLAPEMAGTLKRDVAEPSDLYSLGAVLYECLVGCPPFQAATLGELLRQHLCQPVPTLRGPLARFDRVVQQLLAKEPQARYPSARAARLELEAALAGRLVPGGPRRAPELVGRAELLAEVGRAHNQLVVLEAPPGGGKTRFLEALEQESAARGITVLTGRGLPEGQWMLLEGVFFELARRGDARLARSLAGHRPVLSELSPSLRAWLGKPEGTSGPDRVFLALDALLEAVAPVLVLLDDLQWGDDLSLRFLARLSRVGLPPGVQVVAAAREGTVPSDLEARRLPLPPLSREDSERLLASLGSDPFALGALIEHARGNPLVLVEGARSPWLPELPSSTRRALEAGAVLGSTFTAAALAHCLGEDPRTALGAARQAQILRSDPEGLRFTFSHERLRERLLAGLSPEERRAWHARAARALEELDPGECFAVSHHYAAAGELDRAAPHAWRAQELAHARCDQQAAERELRIVLAADPTRLEAGELLGESLRLQGKYAEGRTVLEEALARTPDPVQRARLHGRLGRLCHSAGWLEQARHHYRRQLDGLGRGPEAVKALGELAEVSAYEAAGGKLVLTLLRAFQIARGQADSPEKVQIQATLATLGQFHPTLRALTLQTAPALLERARRLPTPLQRGRALARALLVPALCNPVETISGLDEACDRLLEGGDLFEYCLVAWTVALCRSTLGPFGPLERLGRTLHRQTDLLDYPWGRIMALGIWAWGAGGDVPPELLDQAEQWPGLAANRAARCQLALARGLRLLRDGRPREAGACLHEALEAPPFPRLWVPLTVWEATAWRQAAERAPTESERQELSRRARRAVRRARHYSELSMPLLLPHALREEGLLAAARGHVHRAEQLLARSRSEAERREQDYEAACTELESRRLFRLDRDEPERRLAAMGASWHVESEPTSPPPSLALADRFEQALEWGRALAQTLEEEALFHRLREAGLALLRAEEAVVLSWPDLRPLAGPPRRLSRSLLEASVRSGRAEVADESSGSESLLLSSVRAALSAPVLVANQAVACLHLTHGQVDGLFSEEEQRLADYLSTLAGAALENSRGLIAQQAERRRLEERQALIGSVLEVASVGLALLDKSTGVIQANQAFRSLLGPHRLPLDEVWPELLEGRRATWQGEVRLGTTPAQLTLARMGEEIVASLGELPARDPLDLIAFQRREAGQLSRQVREELAEPLGRLEELLVEGRREEARRLAGTAVADLARLITELRNPVVEGQPLLAALRAALQRFGRDTGITLRARLPRRAPDGPVAEVAFRLLQQLLARLHRGGARQVRVLLRTRKACLEIRVDHDAARVQGLALPRARARLIGGRVRRRPGRLWIRLPLEQA